jgi:hypothetical protein
MYGGRGGQGTSSKGKGYGGWYGKGSDWGKGGEWESEHDEGSYGKGYKGNRAAPYAKGKASGTSYANQELPAVRQDEWYMRKVLRPYPSKVGSSFYKVKGAKNDREILDPTKMAEKLTRFNEEGYNRIGYWLSMTAASYREGAKVSWNESEDFKNFKQFRFFMDSDAGEQFLKSVIYLDREADENLKNYTTEATEKHLHAFMAVVCDQDNTNMFQRLAHLSSKVYVMAMAMLQSKAVVENRRHWTDELQQQLPLMPNEIKPFLHEPEDDEAMVQACTACYHAQVVEKSDGDHMASFLDDPWGENGAAPMEPETFGKSKSPSVKKVFGAKAKNSNSTGSGNGTPTSLFRKNAKIGKEEPVDTFFGAKKLKLDEKSKEKVLEAEDSSMKSPPKAAEPWTPDKTYVVELALVSCKEQLDQDDAIEDQDYLADLMEQFPLKERTALGLPAKIDRATFSEDGKKEFDLLVSAVHKAKQMHLKHYITLANQSPMGKMHAGEYNGSGLIKTLHSGGYDFKASQAHLNELMKENEDEDMNEEGEQDLVKLQQQFLKASTNENDAIEKFNLVETFLSSHAVKDPTVDEIAAYLASLDDTFRKAMGMREELQWKGKKMRLKDWKDEVKKRTTIACLVYKAFHVDEP